MRRSATPRTNGCIASPHRRSDRFDDRVSRRSALPASHRSDAPVELGRRSVIDVDDHGLGDRSRPVRIGRVAIDHRLRQREDAPTVRRPLDESALRGWSDTDRLGVATGRWHDPDRADLPVTSFVALPPIERDAIAGRRPGRVILDPWDPLGTDTSSIGRAAVAIQRLSDDQEMTVSSSAIRLIRVAVPVPSARITISAVLLSSCPDSNTIFVPSGENIAWPSQ